MMKKIITIMILLSLLIIPCMAEYTITTDVTDHSIKYNFSPAIDKQDEIFFDNEKIPFYVDSELIMCGLEPDTCYRLTIQNLPDTVQHIHTHTLPITEPPFYARYGILGLFIIIIGLLIIASKIEYTGYIAVLLSGIGFIYILKNENPDFLTALIFAILLFSSILITGLTIKKEY